MPRTSKRSLFSRIAGLACLVVLSLLVDVLVLWAVIFAASLAVWAVRRRRSDAVAAGIAAAAPLVLAGIVLFEAPYQGAARDAARGFALVKANPDVYRGASVRFLDAHDSGLTEIDRIVDRKGFRNEVTARAVLMLSRWQAGREATISVRGSGRVDVPFQPALETALDFDRTVVITIRSGIVSSFANREDFRSMSCHVNRDGHYKMSIGQQYAAFLDVTEIPVFDPIERICAGMARGFAERGVTAISREV